MTNPKKLGDYVKIINEYVEAGYRGEIITTKTGLMLRLGIDRNNIVNWQRRDTKTKRHFMSVYRRAEQQILEQRLTRALVEPKTNWEYVKYAFPNEFPKLDNDDNNTVININIDEVRDVKNE